MISIYDKNKNPIQRDINEIFNVPSTDFYKNALVIEFLDNNNKLINYPTQNHDLMIIDGEHKIDVGIQFYQIQNN